MRRYKLVEGKWNTGQYLVAGLWAANLIGVVILWATTSTRYFSYGAYGWVLAFGQLLGLLATYFALVQFIILGRVSWIEHRFGLDRLAHFHRLNGYAAITAIVLHPLFITLAYSIGSRRSFIAQYIETLLNFSYVWMALIAEILFIAVVATSIYIVRKHLRFESWYYVHMAVYAAIVLAFFHQFALGGSLNSHPLARNYWYALYLFVALNVLFWRFSLPTINLLRFSFRVSKIEAETPTSTSLYISGKQLDRWKVKPGQYVLVRIFAKGLWWQEHPFSVSRMPQDNTFRLTARHVGDYTSVLRHLQPGKPVLVSGPFGRFTIDVAKTQKRLFIAGGVGITPVRTLAEEAVNDSLDSVLLYSSRSPEDVILQNEIHQLDKQGLKTTYLYGTGGRLDGKRIKQIAPDYLERDIYICGPPAMMDMLIEELLDLGVSPERLHYERFSLHN